MAQRLLRTVMRIAISMAALSVLAGCIASETPILDQSQKPFGDAAKFQFYNLSNGAASDPSTLQLRWTGARYTAIGSDLHPDNAFTFHQLDGNDFVMQAIDGRPDHKVEYAVVRQAAEGVYLVNVVDEDDADAATRAKFCLSASGCRVTTPEQVMGLARATAAKPHKNSALVIRIADDK